MKTLHATLIVIVSLVASTTHAAVIATESFEGETQNAAFDGTADQSWAFAVQSISSQDVSYSGGVVSVFGRSRRPIGSAGSLPGSTEPRGTSTHPHEVSAGTQWSCVG